MEKDELNRTIGKNIKKLRKARGYTPTELAELIGKNKDAVYCYEEGKRTIPVSLLYQLSKIYDVTIDDIINGRIVSSGKGGVILDCYKNNNREERHVNPVDNEILLYEKDEWTMLYYVKCINVVLDKEVLVMDKGRVHPAVISYDKKYETYSVYDTEKMSTTLMKMKQFQKEIVVLGSYAGRVEKQMQVPNFL